MTANVVNIPQVYFVVSAVSQVSDIIILLLLVSLLPLKADDFRSLHIVRVSSDMWYYILSTSHKFILLYSIQALQRPALKGMIYAL